MWSYSSCWGGTSNSCAPTALATALRELPETSQATGDLTSAPPQLQDRIQDLAARYGLAAAVTARLTFGQGTLRELDFVDSELRELDAALPPTAAPEVKSAAQVDPSGLVSALDLALRQVSVGKLTSDDLSLRDERVSRDLAPVLPELLASAPGFDPVELVATAWLVRGEQVSDQARRAMRGNGGSAPIATEPPGQDRHMLHTPDPRASAANASRSRGRPGR